MCKEWSERTACTIFGTVRFALLTCRFTGEIAAFRGIWFCHS